MIDGIRLISIVLVGLASTHSHAEEFVNSSSSSVGYELAPYSDADYISSLRRPISISGDYARAISEAYNHFMGSHKRFSDDSYSVTVTDIDSCIYVQIFMNTTKPSTAIPYYYCVDKFKFDVRQITEAEVKAIFKMD